MFQVIWADNDLVCYVAYKHDEHRFTSGYHVLLVEDAREYVIVDVGISKYSTCLPIMYSVEFVSCHFV